MSDDFNDVDTGEDVPTPVKDDETTDMDYFKAEVESNATRGFQDETEDSAVREEGGAMGLQEAEDSYVNETNGQEDVGSKRAPPSSLGDPPPVAMAGVAAMDNNLTTTSRIGHLDTTGVEQMSDSGPPGLLAGVVEGQGAADDAKRGFASAVVDVEQIGPSELLPGAVAVAGKGEDPSLIMKVAAGADVEQIDDISRPSELLPGAGVVARKGEDPSLKMKVAAGANVGYINDDSRPGGLFHGAAAGQDNPFLARRDNAKAAPPNDTVASTMGASIIALASENANSPPNNGSVQRQQATARVICTPLQEQQATVPVIRPPPRSMVPDEPAKDPSVRMFHEVEATLVPDEPDMPIYDATPVEDEAARRNRQKKYLFGGIVLLVCALAGAVAIGVFLGSSNDDDDGNNLDGNVVQPSSASPTDTPTIRPTSSPTDTPTPRPTSLPTTSPTTLPTTSPIAIGNIGNGRCDPFFNVAEFQYDGGDCCQATCASTDEHSCGVDGGGLAPRKYVGYSSCADPAQQCPRDADGCWNVLPPITGPSKAVISRNGAVVAVASPPQVFEQDGSRWIPRSLSLDEVTVSGPQSSLALSSDGSVVAISLPVDTDVLAKGKVMVFRWNAAGESYDQIGEDILVDAVTWAGVAHGGAVALSDDGSTLAIGAPESFTSIQIGFVLVYEFKYHSYRWKWTQLAELRGRDGDEDDNFGRSLAMSSDGKVIAAGAPHAKDWAGYVRVYKYNQETAMYDLTGHFEGDTIGETFYGNAVSLSAAGDILAIGAHRSSSGYVDIVEWGLGSRGWGRNGKLVGDVGEYFGEALALSGDGRRLVVGSTLTDTSVGTNAGSVLSYKYNETGGWEKCMEVLEGAEPYIFFGRSISLSEDGGTLTVGNDGNWYRDDAVGSVNIYRLVEPTAQTNTALDDPASDTVAITVAIQLDNFPEKTGFSLECGGVRHASVPVGGLAIPSDFRYETFFVANQTDCTFMIFDSTQDGIYGPYGKGYYKIYFGEDTSSEDNLLAKGGQMFGGQEKIAFTATPPVNLVPVTITLGQGRYGGEDTDFYLRCSDVLETELLTESAFRTRGPVTGDTFLIPNGTLCNFTKTDLNEAGGTYNITIDDTIVAASDSFGFGNQISFIVAPPDLLPQANISSYCCIFVQIFLDEYPSETGWNLTCDKNVLYEALPGTYPERYPSIYESFCLFNMTSCEFRLTDSYGDGFNGQYKLGTWGDISGQRFFVDKADFSQFSFNVTHEFDASCPKA